MADLTISSAATLTGAGTASGDLFPLVDVSAAAGSKGSKITRDELRIAMGLTGGGVVATAGFTLTVPTTGTAALLGTANVFTALQTITQGTANAGILASTGYSLTGSNATNMIDLAGTWNTTGKPTGIKLNITNTASAQYSRLLDIQVSGTSYIRAAINFGNPQLESTSGFVVGQRDGNIYGTFDGGISVNSNAVIGFTSAYNNAINNAQDAFFARKAAATIQLGADAAGVTNQMLTAASRITSDGVGANLTIAGGNGRGGAGGSLIFGYYTTAAAATVGTLTTAMSILTGGQVKLESTSLLCFGGITAGESALKNSGGVLQARVADDSTYAGFDALSYSVGGTPGATGGTYTNISSITIVNGIVIGISGT